MSQRTPEEKRAYHREYHRKNKERFWERNLQNKYGITVEDYERMLDEQGGGCAICGATEDPYPGRSKLNVDHDHETGRVRGILCTACNRAVGFFREDPELLRNAADYITGARTGRMSSGSAHE